MIELMVMSCGHCGKGFPWCATRVATRPKSESDAKRRLIASEVHRLRAMPAKACPLRLQPVVKYRGTATKNAATEAKNAAKRVILTAEDSDRFFGFADGVLDRGE